MEKVELLPIEIEYDTFVQLKKAIHYIKVDMKCAQDNPDLPPEFIKDMLISKNTDRSLAEPFEL